MLKVDVRQLPVERWGCAIQPQIEMQFSWQRIGKVLAFITT